MRTGIMDSIKNISIKNIGYTAFLVTYNRAENLSIIIESILNQSLPPSKLIIINNCSIDRTKIILNGYLKNEFIKIINSPSNIGHGAALALGFENYVQNYFKLGEILMLFEDDSKPHQMLFEYMVKPFLQKKLDMLCLDGYNINIGRRRKPIIKRNQITEVDFGLLDGCLISSNLIKEVGFPVRNWFMMYDDIEFCKRIRLSGYKIYCIKNKFHQINHSGASSSWRVYYQSRNHVHYLLKYFSFTELLDFTIIELKRCIGNMKQRDWHKVKLRINGIVAGIKGEKGMTLEPTNKKDFENV